MKRAQQIIKSHDPRFYYMAFPHILSHEWVKLLHELKILGKRKPHINIINAINNGESSALITHKEELFNFTHSYPILTRIMLKISPQETITPVIISSSIYLDTINPLHVNEDSLSFIQNEKTAEILYINYRSLLKVSKCKFFKWIRENNPGLVYWSLQHNRNWIDEGLAMAAQEGKETIVKILLSHASLSSCKEALEVATEYRRADVIKILLLDQRIVATQKTFSVLCLIGCYDLVKLLLSSINPSSNDLYLASSKGHSRIVRLLLLDKRIYPNDKRIIEDSIRYGHTETLRTLLKDKRIIIYPSLLTIAAENGHTEILRLLLSYNIKPDISSIIQATRRNYIDCVRILLPYGYKEECREEAMRLNKEDILDIFNDEGE